MNWDDYFGKKTGKDIPTSSDTEGSFGEGEHECEDDDDGED